MTNRYGIFTPRYRALTVGIILAVTVVAFDGMAFTTVAPVIAKELHGIELYGWLFSAFLLTQLTGTVIAGQQIDQRGTALPFVAALFLFGLGAVTAAIAPSMPILIIGRALQGFGAGAIITCVYTSITLRYDDSLRPQILAVFSSAYVLPALIGPYVAGIIAEYLTWRLLFWGLLLFLLLVSIFTLPTFRRLTTKGKHSARTQVLPAVQLAVGTGLLLTGFGWLPRISGVFLVFGGLLLVVSPLGYLLPAGTFVARSGLPAMVAARGLFVASYFGTETFLVLALTTLKNYGADTAGLIVSSGALSWSVAAWLQARLDRRQQGSGRRMRVLFGVVLMLVGIVATAQVVWIPNNLVTVFAIACHIVTGFGIGLAHPTSGVIAFAYATDGTANAISEGVISAVLQVADTFTPAVGIGIGGALVAISHATGQKTYIGVAAALGIQILFITLGLVSAYRLQCKQPPNRTSLIPGS